jgi:hypothetical protein
MLNDYKAWNVTTRPVSARIDEDLLESLQKLGKQKNTVINYILREYLVAVERAIAEDPRLADRVRFRRYLKCKIEVTD